jgi:hypothetical protein
MLDGAGGIMRAKCLVSDGRKRCLVGRRLQHSIQLGLLSFLGGSLQDGRALLQTARQEQRFLERYRSRRSGIRPELCHQLRQ